MCSVLDVILLLNCSTVLQEQAGVDILVVLASAVSVIYIPPCTNPMQTLDMMEYSVCQMSARTGMRLHKGSLWVDIL